MTTESKNQLTAIIAKNVFASKIASTVLVSGACSWKQFEILNDASDDYMDFGDLNTPDSATEIKHDTVFESIQEDQRKNQSAAL